MKSSEILKEISAIVKNYEIVVKGIERDAQNLPQRAYGGIVRAGKGKLVENIAKNLIELASRDLGLADSLTFDRQIVKIPIRRAYIEKIKSPDVRDYINKHMKKFFYPLKTDIHVNIDGKFIMAVECKAYTENAMLKRILVDFTLFKQILPDLKFVLFQLESQLGGDYSSLKSVKFGSPSTHTLLSYFDIDLNIITLLEGERMVDKPIHKPGFYKPLGIASVMSAFEIMKDLLK